ncbi:MAG TPA: hypothetical protein VMU07_00880 [Candidatus Paceibacterota bacterium]|nr:hypothetical protein [Candidatus Paceibacterota bacterium]
MKAVSIVLAIGTAIILGALINLGISAFYPGPQYPDYSSYVKPMPAPVVGPCAANDAQCKKDLAAQQAQEAAQQAAYDTANQDYQAAAGIYNHNLFVVANVIGVVVFLIGFFIVLYAGLVSKGVPVGIMIAGLWSIVYGYARGWGDVGDKWKFAVGLVIAFIVIGGSMWLMQRHAKRTDL